METKQLCPSKLNELGKGVFSPEEEAEFLEEGYIFACNVPGTLVGTLLICKRPIADAVTDSILKLPTFRKYRQPATAPIPNLFKK